MFDFTQADLLIDEIISKQRQIDSIETNAKKLKEAHIAAIVEKIDKWLNEETEQLKTDVDIAKALLSPIVEEYLQQNPKKRSLKLPSGRAGFRKGDITFSLNSNSNEKLDGKSSELLQVVKSHNLDSFVLQKEYVNWAGLKKSLNTTDDGKVITSDGELLPELSAKLEPDSFFVKEGK